MGRGHDSDVRINDISVSRTHSCLTLNNKKILLKDYKSKFGTLILVQNEIEVKENKLSLQIGRSYFETMLLNKVNEKYFRNNLRNSNEKLNKSVNNSSKQTIQFFTFFLFHGPFPNQWVFNGFPGSQALPD